MSQTAVSPSEDARPAARAPRSRWTRTRAMVAVAAAVTMLGAPASASAADVPTDPATTVGSALPTATPLSWAPPELENPTTVKASASNRNIFLDATRDYIIQMPATPIVTMHGLQIHGGRNVVLIGGQIELPIEAIDSTTHAGRGLYLQNQRGTVHVEGLRITGPGLEDGINLDQRYGAKVQLQNIRVDTTHGSSSGAHADVLQTWAGPRQLLVDGLTGHTEYQGLFMLPTQQWTDAVEPEVFDLRRVDLHGTSTSGYLMWRDSRAWPLKVQDVWVAPKDPSWRDGFLWPKGTLPGSEAWPFVKVGSPSPSEFVPVGTAGLGYVSPGYRAPEPVVTEPVVTDPVVTDPVVTEPVVTEPEPEPLPVPPVGALDGVVAVDGGARVTGWAADGDATAPISVDVTVGGTTQRVTADGLRSDVAALQPELGTNTGFDAVVPLPLGTHEVCVTAVNVGSGTDLALGCRTVTVVDVNAPVFTADPSLALRNGTVSTAGVVPVTARFPVTDDHGIREIALTSPFAATYAGTTTSADVEVGTGTRTWTVTARDAAGNAATASTTRTVGLVAETDAVRSKGWTAVKSTGFLGGKALRSDTAGSTMSHTFTGRGVAWVASQDATSGRAHVYVDGTQVATVDLAATTATHRQVVFTRSWESSGTHTVKVVVEGTGGRPGVTSDGFVTLS